MIINLSVNLFEMIMNVNIIIVENLVIVHLH